MKWYEKMIIYTGRVRCPNCAGQLSQTKNAVPGNTKAVVCKNCNKQYLIPRDKWSEYTTRGLI